MPSQPNPNVQPLPQPDEEPAREIFYPTCPGCPDPDNASKRDGLCFGPEEIKLEDLQISSNQKRNLGKPACESFIYCPKTRGTRISKTN